MPKPPPFPTEPDTLRLEALVDFPDDAIAAPCALTPDHIDAFMAQLADLGVRRISWGYYGDGHGGWIIPTDYGKEVHGGWQHYADTYQNLGNPLAVAVDSGHRHGLEVYATFKPYETGAGMLFPEGSPQAEAMGLTQQIGGKVAWMEPFVHTHPHLRLRRRSDDMPAEHLTAPICSIRLFKQNDEPTRIKKENLQIWVSDDNWCYQQIEMDFILTESIETASHTTCDHEGNILTHAGEKVRILTLSGLNLTDRFVLLTTDFETGPADFKNGGTHIFKAYDQEDQEILGVFASGKTIWTPDLVHFRTGGLSFDYGWGAACVALDAPHASGTEGFIAFSRGRNSYLSGSLCETEPEVQAFWFSCLEEMIEAGVDGVDFREESHSCHSDYVEDYGFNEAVLEQCGQLGGHELLAKINHIRSKAYTEFLRRCKALLSAKNCAMRHNLQFDLFRSDPPSNRRLALPANITFDWQRWVDEGLMDEAILRFYATPFEDLFEDPVCAEMMESCQRKGIPLSVNRYVDAAGDQLSDEIQRIQEDERLSGFIFYETMNFLKFDSNGGCSLTQPSVQKAAKSV